MSNAVERCKSQLSSFAKAAALFATSRSASIRAGAARQFMKSDFDLFPSNMFRGAYGAMEGNCAANGLSVNVFRRISDFSRRILKSLFSGENVNSDYEFVMSE